MTYPDEHAGELSREALFEVLEQVDLTYLLDRDGVMVSHTIDAFSIRSGCSEVDASESTHGERYLKQTHTDTLCSSWRTGL